MADLYLKIRIKLGDNEFEADGPVDIVRAEIDGFKRLIGFKAETGHEEAASAAHKSRADIAKISRIQGRIVSLKLQTKSVAHAVLAVLLGQQLLRNNTSVMGSEIMDGLRQSGYKIARADHILRYHIADANVRAAGTHRRRRYRLTNRGVEMAQEVARRMAAALQEQSGDSTANSQQRP